jgi:hypothetical protein
MALVSSSWEFVDGVQSGNSSNLTNQVLPGRGLNLFSDEK